MVRCKTLFAALLLHLLAACTGAVELDTPDQHGQVEVGQSKDVTYTLSNLGTHAALGLTFAPLPSGWTHVDGSCGAALASKASCTHVVRFSPEAVGDYTATLAATYRNLKGQIGTILRPLHGVGVQSPAPSCYRGVKTYTGYAEGGAQDLNAWEGDLSVLYARERFDDVKACQATEHLDACAALYKQMGQRDWPIQQDPYFPGKATLAIVPATCPGAAGCGSGGKAEMLESIFERDGGDVADPYALWVGYYEFGRAVDFPFYEIMTTVPDRMTAAFPEYIWSTCLRNLGLSGEELARRGQWSPALYRERFLSSTYQYADYQDQPANAEWNGVAPSQVMAAVFYYLHIEFGADYMQSFFAQARARQAKGSAPTDGRDAACHLLQIAEAAEPARREEVKALLVSSWRFPADCPDVVVYSIDLQRYCVETFGDGWTANLGGTTAFDWQCVSPSGERRGMDLNAACSSQYGQSNAAYGDFNDPYSWYCVAP